MLGAGGLGVFVFLQGRAYDAAVDKVYDVPPLAVTRSTDPIVLARGEHLAKSLGGCAAHDCHGSDLGGGRVLEMGPVGTFTAPNITVILPTYSDGELARLLRHGIKKDGRTIRFMPVVDFDWLPDSDLTALVSWLRTVPTVDRPNGAMQVKALGRSSIRRTSLPSTWRAASITSTSRPRRLRPRRKSTGASSRASAPVAMAST